MIILFYRNNVSYLKIPGIFILLFRSLSRMLESLFISFQLKDNSNFLDALDMQ